ncbi:hypothetical protein AB0J72_18995 [Dactylosporangium sp. NPDC049742]|uniref:hypothetical protein n=1 Tax=Dactylosporangium sp. NPDC049742 TaxID=3154737 RepID=UPI00343FE5D5
MVRRCLSGLVVVATLLSGCSSPQPAPRPARPAQQQQTSMTGPQAYSALQNGQQIDYSQLSCPALEYLANKYTSIAESAERISDGDSPAAASARLQAAQAYNMASRMWGYRSQKTC